jgi:hypothetical protein
MVSRKPCSMLMLSFEWIQQSLSIHAPKIVEHQASLSRTDVKTLSTNLAWICHQQWEQEG